MSVPLSEISDDYLRRVERDRRRRERDLLLLLVAFFDTGPNSVRRQVIVAASHGFDTGVVIRNAVGGSANHRGVAPVIARTSAQAHRDGYRRIGLAAGTTAVSRSDAGTLADLIDLYLPQARMAAAAMVQALTDKIVRALFAPEPDATIRQTVTGAFDDAGYGFGSASALSLAAERAVVGAHNAGVMDGAFNAPPLKGVVTGLEHVSIIDNRTTPICLDRHELKLPLDHPYWRSGQAVPPLHFRCRSALRPLLGDFTPSDQLPTVPVMPGFGGGPLPPFARAA
jgi:hypothetical protein